MSSIVTIRQSFHIPSHRWLGLLQSTSLCWLSSGWTRASDCPINCFERFTKYCCWFRGRPPLSMDLTSILKKNFKSHNLLIEIPYRSYGWLFEPQFYLTLLQLCWPRQTKQIVQWNYWHSRNLGLCQLIRKISDNAYVGDLPKEYISIEPKTVLPIRQQPLSSFMVEWSRGSIVWRSHITHTF